VKNLVLGDALDALIDHRGKTPKKLGADFTMRGVPVASASMVNGGVLNLEDARCVSNEVFERWMPVRIQAGDVLLTSEAPLGRVAVVSSGEPLVLGQRLFGLRGKPGVLDSRYLFYALQTEAVQTELVGRSTGTTVSGIRQSALQDLRIPAPEFEQQKAIAEVLGILDAKIAANVSLASTASRLACQLVADRRPSILLSEISIQHKETVDPSTLTCEEVEHFSLPAFDMGCGPERVAPSVIKSSKFIIDAPCVLLSKLNPRIPRIWDVCKCPSQTAVSSTEFVVLESKYSTSSVLWSILAQASFSAAIEAKVGGTSGSHQRVRPADLLSTMVIDPRCLSGDTQKEVTRLGECVALRNEQSMTLAATRDALLPLLMSGIVHVKDAKRTAEKVL
jgi:type I restriction enzyme S subunit